jgi:phosphate transport system protein
MCVLVQAQMHKAKETLLKFDKDLAYEVVMNEQKIDAFHLKITRDCESILSIFKPSAHELRFVLAALKIVGCIERCGDFAEWIALYISEIESSFDKPLLKKCQMFEMFEEIDAMMYAVHQALDKKDSTSLKTVFEKDEILGRCRMKAMDSIAQYIQQNPEQAQRGLYLFAVVMKLERVGDQLKNVAHEIIFCLEASEHKHVRKRSEAS